MSGRRGISPVIATVIIVAVTIAVTIAVAFWLTGLIGMFTGYEQLSIDTIYAEPDTTAGSWTITLSVSNKGTSPTSITQILINGVDMKGSTCSGVTLSNPSELPISFNPGDSKTIVITVNMGGQCGATTFVSGGSVEVKLHSSGGKDYPKLIVLP